MKTPLLDENKKAIQLFPGNPVVFSSPEGTRGFSSSSYAEFGFLKDFT
jgi:hypothetical protein